MNINAFRLPKSFTDKFPDMPIERAEKHYNKYLEIMREQLLRQLPYIDDDKVNINLDKLWSYRFKYNNEYYYIWQEFNQIQPFVYIVDKGSNIKNHISIGKILDQKLIDLLIDTADTLELVKMYYGDISLNDMVMIPIDMKSTRGYINATEYKLQSIDTNNNYYNKVLANLRSAKYIKLISEYFYPKYGSYVLPHIPSVSLYGRTYYKGINLQNISKEVRAAVLGTHYQYDIYAAIFAIKLFHAQEILNKENKSVWREFSYTTEYLENKDLIRSRLGKLITHYPDGKKLAKEAITAIGFGARLSGGAWLEGLKWQTSSIKDIIKNRDDFKAFVSDTWLQNFHREQKQLTKLIVDDTLQNIQFVEKINTLPDIKSINGNYNKQKIMSYIFQHTETKLMDAITSYTNPIIRIHDAFLTKDKINNNTLIDIKTMLNQTCEFFKIEATEIQGWNSFDAITEEIRHKEFIKSEELKANNGIMPVTYKKSLEQINNHDDYECYDGYDTGSRHEEYDPDYDQCVSNMTELERLEHYRIIGYNPNQLPSHIQKLLKIKS